MNDSGTRSTLNIPVSVVERFKCLTLKLASVYSLIKFHKHVLKLRYFKKKWIKNNLGLSSSNMALPVYSSLLYCTIQHLKLATGDEYSGCVVAWLCSCVRFSLPFWYSIRFLKFIIRFVVATISINFFKIVRWSFPKLCFLTGKFLSIEIEIFTSL